MTIEELLAVRGPVVEWWRDQHFVTVRYRARRGTRTFRAVLKEDVHTEARLYSEGLPLPAPPVLAVDADTGRVLLAVVPVLDAPWSEPVAASALDDLSELHQTAGLQWLPSALPLDPAPVLMEAWARWPSAAPAVPEAARRALDLVLADHGPVWDALAAAPSVFLHGDPWTGNVLRTMDGRRLWIDWDGAARGPAALDTECFREASESWHGPLGLRDQRDRAPVEAAANLWRQVAVNIPALSHHGRPPLEEEHLRRGWWDPVVADARALGYPV